MAKKRVYEMARELGLENKELVEKLRAMGFSVKSHSSSLEEVEAEAAMAKIRGSAEQDKPKKVVAPAGVVREGPLLAPGYVEARLEAGEVVLDRIEELPSVPPGRGRGRGGSP